MAAKVWQMNGFVKFHWANSSSRRLRLKAVKNAKKDTGAGLVTLCSENPPKSFQLRAPFLSFHLYMLGSLNLSCERCI